MFKQKGQGMTEYAVILALIVAIALAVYNSGTLQASIEGVFNSISSTMTNAEERQRQEADLSNAKKIAKLLAEALQNENIKFSDNKAGDSDWVELSVQKKEKSNGAYLDGGIHNSHTNNWSNSQVNGRRYGQGYPEHQSFNDLWQTFINSTLDSSALRVQQNDNDWYGVRVYGNSSQDGKPKAYYYTGSSYQSNGSPDFDKASRVELSY